MHELSIATSLVSLAEAAAQDAGDPGAIRAVQIRIGDLSGVVVEALEFAWDSAIEGTRCDGARLEIERVAGRVRCAACDAETVLDAPPIFACVHCGGPATDIVAGRELDLISLELEDCPASTPAEAMEEPDAAPHP